MNSCLIEFDVIAIMFIIIIVEPLQRPLLCKAAYRHLSFLGCGEGKVLESQDMCQGPILLRNSRITFTRRFWPCG